MTSTNWINNRIMMGSAPQYSLDYQDLREAGITHIIDMRLESKGAHNDSHQEDANLFGLRRFHFPIEDGYMDGSAELIDQAIRRVVEILAANRVNKVYIHCAAGISRSATVVIGVLVHLGMSLTGARAHVKRCRPCTNPDEFLWKTLEKIMGSDHDAKRVLL